MSTEVFAYKVPDPATIKNLLSIGHEVTIINISDAFPDTLIISAGTQIAKIRSTTSDFGKTPDGNEVFLHAKKHIKIPSLGNLADFYKLKSLNPILSLAVAEGLSEEPLAV